MKPNLKLAENKGVHERAMEQIEAGWDAWHGDLGQRWNPVDNTEPLGEQVSKSLDKGRYIVKIDSPIPWHVRLIRWIKRIG